MQTSLHIDHKASIAKAVLMPGDPLRAKFVAETFLENPVMFNSTRNMLGYTGTYKGRSISVMGSGMGIPTITLYAYELYHLFGVEAILRVGSTGALQEDAKLGDIILAMAASTNSNVVHGKAFDGYIAPCASHDLLQWAIEAANTQGTPVTAGLIFSSDYFYDPIESTNATLRDLGHLCVDMETAGLYICAQRARKKALSMLTVSDTIFTHEAISRQARQETFHDMMRIALDTAWHIAE